MIKGIRPGIFTSRPGKQSVQNKFIKVRTLSDFDLCYIGKVEGTRASAGVSFILVSSVEQRRRPPYKAGAFFVDFTRGTRQADHTRPARKTKQPRTRQDEQGPQHCRKAATRPTPGRRHGYKAHEAAQHFQGPRQEKRGTTVPQAFQKIFKIAALRRGSLLRISFPHPGRRGKLALRYFLTKSSIHGAASAIFFWI